MKPILAALIATALNGDACPDDRFDFDRRTGRFDNRTKREPCDHCPLKPATLHGVVMLNGDNLLLCELHAARALR